MWFDTRMKLAFRILSAALFTVALMTGCASFESTRTSGDFIRPTDLSSFDSFRYEHTMVSGMVYRMSSQEMVMKELSEKVLTQSLSERGYTLAGQDAKFYVVSKWRKEINMSAAEAVRFSLVVELYDAPNKTLFWRAELPYIFNAMQWSEGRISQTLRLAIQNFPNHMATESE